MYDMIYRVTTMSKPLVVTVVRKNFFKQAETIEQNQAH